MIFFLLKLVIIFLLVFLVLLFYSCASKSRLRSLGRSLYQQVEDGKLPWKIFAKSVENRNLRLLKMGEGEHTTMIFGAFHGSEPESADLTIRFAEYLYYEFANQLDSKVIIVPVVNPDGLCHGVRTNAKGVDLNRNFPTRNWQKKLRGRKHFPGLYPASEPETKAVMALIDKFKPDRIISIHSPLRLVNYDGPAQELALNMALLTGYPVKNDIGYPTPGSLGNYAGREKEIPTITLELPRKSLDQIWNENREALLIALIY